MCSHRSTFTALESHKSSFQRKNVNGCAGCCPVTQYKVNVIKLKYVSALRIVPSVVTLLCKLKCNKKLGMTWRAWQNIWYGLAGMVLPGCVWDGIWWGLAG